MLYLLEVYVGLVGQEGLHFPKDVPASLLVFEVQHCLENGSARRRLLRKDAFLEMRKVVISESDRVFGDIFIIFVHILLVPVGFDVDQLDGLFLLLQSTSPQAYIFWSWSCWLMISVTF